MQMKKGVSLIVLVITIIVMTILAGVIILSLSNAGIITKAEEAVDKTNLSEVQHLATLIWSEKYLEQQEAGVINEAQLATDVKNALAQEGITEEEYIINVTKGGVEIKKGKIITFSIKDASDSIVTQYQAEEGMTWTQWAASSYNTVRLTCNTDEENPGYYISETGFIQVLYYIDETTGKNMLEKEIEDTSGDGKFITGKNKIVEGVEYTTGYYEEW